MTGYQEAWGGPIHQNLIQQRENAEPEYFVPAVMLHGSPLESPAWQELQVAVKAFIDALPPEVKTWVTLGTLIAEIVPPSGDVSPDLGHISVLRNHLSQMQPESLFKDLPVNLESATLEKVSALHSLLLQRLSLGEQNDGQDAADLPAGGGSEGRDDDSALAKIRPALKVIILMSENPEMTVTEAARQVGCCRTSLYRDPKFLRFKEMRQCPRTPRKGIHTQDEEGNMQVDGIDEHKPFDDIED
ncbi:MAG: hypothetical protein ACYC3I_27270 [Gemmataceae bacterium]